MAHDLENSKSDSCAAGEVTGDCELAPAAWTLPGHLIGLTAGFVQHYFGDCKKNWACVDSKPLWSSNSQRAGGLSASSMPPTARRLGRLTLAPGLLLFGQWRICIVTVLHVPRPPPLYGDRHPPVLRTALCGYSRKVGSFLSVMKYFGQMGEAGQLGEAATMT